MGWFVVTILVPVLAPMLLLPLYRLLPIPAKSKANAALVCLLKDGQLCWAALGFCASALFEVADAVGKPYALTPTVANWTNGGLIVILVISALFASAGAVFPTPRTVPAGRPAVRHFSTMIASVVLTAIAASAYTVVHFMASAP